jgi:Ca-activated chloride channel homolog
MKVGARSLVVIGLLVGIAVAGGAFATSERQKVQALPEAWRQWLEQEVYPLISSAQRKAFLELQTDAERKEFADRLWTLWGEETGNGVAFRSIYKDRLDECHSRFGNTTEDRARELLLHGVPTYLKVIDCDQVFYPIEVWQWAYLEKLGQNVTVLFYKPYGLGRYRLWDPFETRNVLYSTPGQMALQQPTSVLDRPENSCGDGREILKLLSMAEYWMNDLRVKESMDHLIEPNGKGPESASARFLQFSTIMPKGSKELDFKVSASFGARQGGEIPVRFSVIVPRAGLGTAKVGDLEVVQLDVTGEISRADEMVDRFRYAFTFPGESQELPVVAERDLRPGTYRLRLKIQDTNSHLAGVQDLDFKVEATALEQTPAQKEAEATVAKLAAGQQPVLSLQGPEGESVIGLQRFSALTGPKVARVEFFLDGHPVLTKNRPPFDVDLDLGPLPRLASVLAVAYDAKGTELDRKQIDLNVGRERFMVRLQPIAASDIADGKVHAVVSVNIPTDRKLEKVDLYWNQTKLATLYQPPFETWLPFSNSKAVGYLRAVALLDGGGQSEDVQFVNAPQFLSKVTVSAVNLPVTVLGRDKKPVEGLKEADFSVLEDGVPQSISFFSLQHELPIRLGVTVDTSGSMEKTLPEVQKVVLGFLQDLLQPRDRAFVVSFSDEPELLEGFTGDFKALERALIALRAQRSTALYDAVVYSLFQFSGVRGRKALIVLTDGKDNASRMDYEKALDYAERSGVIIYTIGVDLPITEVRTRSQLSRLARVTGGEVFFIRREDSLTPIYEQINRELRTQYLIAYTSNSGAAPDAFRKVTVEVKRPHVEVRTIAGYYPGG